MFTDRARTMTRGVVEPLAYAIGRVGLTPNGVTLIGMSLHVLVAALLALGYFAVGGALLFIASGIDGLDGTLARLTGKTTPFGAFFDSTLDRISEVLTFLGLILYLDWRAVDPSTALYSPALVYAAATGSLMVSYSRARAEGIGSSTKVGFMGRMERMALVVLGLVTGWIGPVLWAVVIGTWLTTAYRVYDVWRQSRPRGRDEQG